MTKIEKLKAQYADKGRLLKADMRYLLDMAEIGAAACNPCADGQEFPLYPEKDLLKDFTNQHVVTLGTSVGIMMLMILEKNLPPHTFIARTGKLGDVRKAIFELAKGTGLTLSHEEINYWAKVWNMTWNVCMERIRQQAEES